MLKLLLIEDNRMTLNYLEHQIQWQSHGLQLVGTATNGQKALALIEELQPDILLTDIRMPVMDGLQLTETVSRQWPDMKTVILTAYDQFAYSQRALKAGAVDYILKPVNDHDLMQVIGRVRDSILQMKRSQMVQEQLLRKFEQSLPLLQQNFLVKLISGYYEQTESFEDILSFLQLRFPGQYFCIALFLIDDFNAAAKNWGFKDKEMVLFSLKASLEEELEPTSAKYLFFHHDQIVAFIHFPAEYIEGREPSSAMRSFIHHCSHVQKRVQQATGFTLSIAVSHLHASLSMAELAYEEAKSSLHHRFFIGNGSLIYKGDLSAQPVRMYNPLLYDKKLTALTISGNVKELTEVLDTFRSELRQNSGMPVHNIKGYFLGMLFQVVNQLYELELVLEKDNVQLDENEILNLLQCDTFENCFALFSEKLLHICNCVIQSQHTRSNAIIHQAVIYATLNYNKDISVEKVAEHVGLNPSYFSHLFKKVMHLSFTSFLTKTRIEKAKALMNNPDLKTSDISELVGMQNPRYFTQLFKRYTGVTPSEYRTKK